MLELSVLLLFQLFSEATCVNKVPSCYDIGMKLHGKGGGVT